MLQSQNGFDLEERTAKFGEDVIAFCKTIVQDSISRPIIVQLIRSATGIGANYLEANAASSKRDFKNKIFICRKEANETRHWLRMLAKCAPDRKMNIRKLWKECNELTLIFHKITATMSKAGQ